MSNQSSTIDQRGEIPASPTSWWRRDVSNLGLLAGVGTIDALVIAAGAFVADVARDKIEASEKTLAASVVEAKADLRAEIHAAREAVLSALSHGLSGLGERVDSSRDAAALMASRDDVRELERRVGNIQQEMGQIAGRLDQIVAAQRAQAFPYWQGRAASWDGVMVPAGFQDIKSLTEGSPGLILNTEAFAAPAIGGADMRFDALRTLLEDGALEPVRPMQ